MLQKITQPLNSGAAALIAVAGLALWTFVSPAKAVVITPGQAMLTTGETAPAFGAPLENTGDVGFSGENLADTVVFTGELDSKVYTDPSTGKLDFVYQFSNDADSDDPIENFSISSFSGLTTDADYLTGTGTTVPVSVQRNAANSGGSLDFSFAPADVVQGAETAELIIKTNAVNYTMGSATFQDGGNVTIAAPTPVPEPATAAIAGLSLLALGIRRRSAGSR